MPSIARDPPIHIPAVTSPTNPAHSAALIFLHGLGDDAEGFENIARQFQAAHKLDYMQWVIPNGIEDRDLMQRAWYRPSPLRPFVSSRPELDDPEDEDGLLRSRAYVEELIAELVHKGVPLERIVLGGFSQGCAMSLLTGLTSQSYAGKLGGIAAIAGYLPLADKIQTLRKEAALPPKVDSDGAMPFFVMRGNRDMLVPKRFLKIQVEKLKDLGVPDAMVEVREYEGLGHSMSGAVLRDLCAWLEKVIPPVE